MNLSKLNKSYTVIEAEEVDGEKWYVIAVVAGSLERWIVEQQDEKWLTLPFLPFSMMPARYKIHESLLTYITLKWDGK